MKKITMALCILSTVLAGCESEQAKAEKKAAHLASLTCESSREGRTQEELYAIGDACFKRGTFKKSEERYW